MSILIRKAAAPRAVAVMQAILLLLLLASPVTGQSALPDTGRVAGDYVIGKQDLLQISVFDLDALNQTVRVQDDGTISLPLIGNLHADGMTRRALEEAIAQQLSPKFVIDPQVSIFVKSYESKKVTVLGAVKLPGSFELIGSRTLLEVISLAGGALKEQAVRTLQVIRRQPDGTSKTVTVDFAALERGDPAANIPIEGGDIIQFPVDDLLYIYVNGAVKTPGLFRVKRSDPVTVLRAVTIAGGVNDRGTGKRVKVLRTEADGSTRAIPVDLKRIQKGKAPDLVLQNNDVVIVPEAYF